MSPAEDLRARQIISEEISGDERLLWSGRPRPGLFFQRSDLYAIPFGLLFLAFSLFWEYGVWKTGNLFMIAWGVPFILTGLYVSFGRFLWEAYVRAGTFYGLTSHRAVVVRRRGSRSVQSVDLDRVETISFRETAGGRGTIWFGAEPSAFAWSGQATAPRPAEFLEIENARAVHELIQRQRRQEASSRGESVFRS